MSRDVITVGSTMRISLLYQDEYSQWRERFMNYLEEQTDGEVMINSIQNGDQPLPVIAQVSLTGNAQNAPPTLKDPKFWTVEEKKTRKIDRLARYLLIKGLSNDIYSLIDSNETSKYLWDALERQMRGSEYGEQDRKAAILSMFNYELNYKFLNNLQHEWKQYATLMRQTKNLMDINNDALYNILKQNQGDVNDTLGYKKKAIVVTSDPLALVAEKTKVSKQKEKVVVSSDSEGSGANDFSELKKITALLAKASNRRKFYSKPTNNNLRTSSTSQSANKKQEFVKSDDKKVEKKDDEKNSDSDQEIDANMVFMAQIEKVLLDSDESFSSTEETIAEVAYYTSESESESELETSEYYDNSTKYDYNYYKTKMLLAKKDSDEQVLLAEDQAWMESNSDESSSSAEEIIAEVAYYTFESESEYEFETSEYYDNSTNYGLFVNNYDDQEIFHDAIKSASENFVENHIDSQKDYDKSEKRIEKANQQSKDLENQNKDLQDKYDVLINQVNTFEEQNNKFNEQIKVLNEKNIDLLAQTEVLHDQLKVKHVLIDTHTECQAKYAKLEEERYEYMIRYSALFDNDKQHRKQLADQEVLFNKMSVQLVELDKNVRDLSNTVLKKDFKISELKVIARLLRHKTLFLVGLVLPSKKGLRRSLLPVCPPSYCKRFSNGR
nr:Gag-Pol polyprotein [Tanacetum cinerariifolium]